METTAICVHLEERYIAHGTLACFLYRLNTGRLVHHITCALLVATSVYHILEV